MDLDESQKEKLREWLDEGLSLSEVQDRLSKEFGISMTYMELRFLVDDLRLEVKDRESDSGGDELGSGSPGDSSDIPSSEPTEVVDEAADSVPFTGGVSVKVDQVTRPGALVSGRVTFSDGKSAEWYLDQLGRLGLAPEDKAYRPSQGDMQAFQMELQKELQRMGL